MTKKRELEAAVEFYLEGEAGDANEVGQNGRIQITGVASNHRGGQTGWHVRSRQCSQMKGLDINYIVISHFNIEINDECLQLLCATISSYAKLQSGNVGRLLCFSQHKQTQCEGM